MSIPIVGWIKEGDTGRSVLFKAPPGLGSWTAHYAVNDGTGSLVEMTTPTVTTIASDDAPGCYALDIDEAGMVTRGNANNFETVLVFIAAAGWSGTPISYVLYSEDP